MKNETTTSIAAVFKNHPHVQERLSTLGEELSHLFTAHGLANPAASREMFVKFVAGLIINIPCPVWAKMTDGRFEPCGTEKCVCHQRAQDMFDGFCVARKEMLEALETMEQEKENKPVTLLDMLRKLKG